MFEIIDTGDLDAALELYEPDAVFVVSPGHVVTGHAAIREVLQGMIAVGATGRLEGVTAVLSADGSVAFTRAKGSSTGPGPDGKPVTTHFHSIEVVRKQPDGTWRIAIDDPSGNGLG
ncbi:MAG TPA: SgcJ/EcaC family oxidoreductase [Deferrisomatales bacterium]|nr:SgcJ/EcaC family oxidoreductase [Deferrisomatales bacterium]